MGLFFKVIIPIPLLLLLRPLLLLLFLLLLSVWWQFNENILVTPSHHPGACEWESHKQTCKSGKNGSVRTNVWSGFKRNATHGGEKTGRKKSLLSTTDFLDWTVFLVTVETEKCLFHFTVCLFFCRGGVVWIVLWDYVVHGWEKKTFKSPYGS